LTVREVERYLVMLECVILSFPVNMQVDGNQCWRSAATKLFSSRRVGGVAGGRDITKMHQAGSREVEVPNLETYFCRERRE
jgi:hypothetical protein